MKYFLAVCLVTAFALWAQLPQPTRRDESAPRLKQSQIEAILKEDHKKSVDDASELLRLAEDLKIELEKSDRHKLSLAAVKKTEDIEKLAKRIRGRLRRF